MLISDLLMDPDEVERAVRALRAVGHDVTVLHVMDPAERSLPASGEGLFVDPESDVAVPARVADVRYITTAMRKPRSAPPSQMPASAELFVLYAADWPGRALRSQREQTRRGEDQARTRLVAAPHVRNRLARYCPLVPRSSGLVRAGAAGQVRQAATGSRIARVP